MACSNIMDIASDSHVSEQVHGLISKLFVLEHAHTGKMIRYVKSQLLNLQMTRVFLKKDLEMTMLKVDSSYAHYILRMQTAGVSYTQPFYNGIFAAR